MFGGYPSGLVARLQRTLCRSIDHLRPYHVPVTAHHSMGATEIVRLVWIQRGMYSAKDDRCTPGSRRSADLVPAQRIAGMNPDTNDVTRLDGVEIERLQRFIDNVRRTVRGGCCCAEYEEPARCNDADAEREMAGVH